MLKQLIAAFTSQVPKMIRTRLCRFVVGLPSRFPMLLVAWSILLTLCVPANAQKNKINFTHLTNLDGLSQSSVQAILKDKYGFLWFGTQDGLNRYDGYDFKVYRHEPNNPRSLSRSDILSLCEDRAGNLWVGTANGGLSLYDRKQDTFKHYKESVAGRNGLSQRSVTSICEDKEGSIWVGTYWKLNRLNPKTGKIVHFENDPNNPATISGMSITSVFEDSRKNLWVGTVTGLNKFNRQTNGFERMMHSDVPGSISSDNVTSICEDDRGRLWISTTNGLNEYHYNTRTFTSYQNSPDIPTSISYNHVKSMTPAGKGKIWLGTIGALELFDPATGVFTHYVNSMRDETSLRLNANIVGLLRDREGILWVGTFQGGINKYDPSLTYFDNHKNNPNDYQSVSFNIITSMAENRDGDVWIGTGGGALNLWKRATNQFLRFNPDPADNNSLTTWGVLSLAQGEKNDYLWVGTYGGGLDRYDPATGHFKHYKEGTAPTDINNNSVYALLEDRRGEIWIGTNGGGVNVLNQQTGLIKKIVADPLDSQALANNFVRCIFEDSQGQIWVGTANGVSVYNHALGKFIAKGPGLRTLENEVVFALYEDPANQIWIGTRGGGLIRFNQQTQQLHTYTTDDGLPGNTINSILEGPNGLLWLSTNHGLCSFHPTTGLFKTYGLFNGIQSFEFSNGAGTRLSNGQILFGGVDGFNAFDPRSFIQNANIPPVVITDFLLYNKSMGVGDDKSPLNQNITLTKELRLRYDQSFIGFEFAALGFTATVQNQYQYKLEGFDQSWSQPDVKRTATYTNLDPGTYTFRVRACNNDGVWNPEDTAISIIILPPFWQTWWFRTLMAVAVVAGSIAIYRFRMRAIFQREVLLKQQVEAQTIQLTHSTRQEQIARQEAETARMETEVANKLLIIKNKDLEQFAYVASHDLQEPLRTTSSFVELLQQQYQGRLDEKADKYINFISDASNRMKVLIQDLLDFSRIGRNVQLREVNCNQVIDNLLEDIQMAIQEKEAVIEVEPLPTLKGYPSEIKLLFQNLVLNAIKFSKKEAPPRIKIAARKIPGYWEFAVSDNGIGIDEKFNDRIFVIFQRLHTRKHYTGSGIGLSHCKKIVELHQGTIWMRSKLDEGSTFYFTLAG